MVPRDILLPSIIGTVGAVLATILIAVRHGRTPLEFVHAPTERAVVGAIRQRARQLLGAKSG